jgi:hypothetical protein
MSSKSTKEPDNNQMYQENTADLPLGRVLSEIIVPFSSLIPPQAEKMPSERSPFHLALLKIEFEKECREFLKRDSLRRTKKVITLSKSYGI